MAETSDAIRAAELRSEAEERIDTDQLHAQDSNGWISTEEADKIFASVAFLQAKTEIDRATLEEAIEDLNIALGYPVLNLTAFHSFEITASSFLDPELREAALRELKILRISRFH